MNISTFEKIQHLQAAGLTITEIARLSGVPQPTVWRIANRKHRHPMEDTALKIDALYHKRCGPISGFEPRDAVA